MHPAALAGSRLTVFGLCDMIYAVELTLKNCQKLVDDWVQTIGIRYFSELTNTAILMEEVGEVARIMSRRFGDQSFNFITI